MGYGFGSGSGDLIAGMPHGPMLQAEIRSQFTFAFCQGRGPKWSSAGCSGHALRPRLDCLFAGGSE